MERIEAKHIVAVWLLASGLIALIRLATRAPEFLAHLSAWRAATGPFVVAVIGITAAARLFRRGDGVRLAATALILPSVALSIGPLAYRLDVGPFVRLSLSSTGTGVHMGSDARLLLVLGEANRVPAGIAVNVAALAILTLLLASHRAACRDR